MAAPAGIAQTNTNGSFVYNNMAVTNGGSLYGSIGGNSNSVIAQPNVQALDFQSATFMSGRQPGGTAFRAASNVALTAPSNSNAAIVMLDNMETVSSHLGYQKNGAFISIVNAAAATISLLNTQVGTNSFAGDTVFNGINEIIFYNLSGLDGNVGVNGTVTVNGTNGVNGVLGGAASVTVPAGSRYVFENVAGLAVNAANLNMAFNAATACTMGVVVMGK